MSWWIVPTIVPGNNPSTQALDKYVVIGVVHGRVTPGGSMVFDPDSSLVVKDGNGQRAEADRR